VEDRHTGEVRPTTTHTINIAGVRVLLQSISCNAACCAAAVTGRTRYQRYRYQPLPGPWRQFAPPLPAITSRYQPRPGTQPLLLLPAATTAAAAECHVQLGAGGSSAHIRMHQCQNRQNKQKRQHFTWVSGNCCAVPCAVCSSAMSTHASQTFELLRQTVIGILCMTQFSC
jgi:hypothetical protein